MMHLITAGVFLALAFALAARAGAVRGYISHWTDLLQPSLILLMLGVGVGFQQRAQSGSDFLWFHWAVLTLGVVTTVLAIADVTRAYRNRRKP